jgi:hypothetical protein
MKRTLTRRYGGEGYCRLTNFVIPALKDLDGSAFDLRRMTV